MSVSGNANKEDTLSDLTCYELIKDGLTILTPFAIAIYVYRLTTGDAKREAKLNALYQLHGSINSVRYQHAIYEIILENQAKSAKTNDVFLSNDEFSQRIINLELARSKLGADCLLVKSVFHCNDTKRLEEEINTLLMSRSLRNSSDEISKLSDNALGSVHYLVEKLT